MELAVDENALSSTEEDTALTYDSLIQQTSHARQRTPGLYQRTLRVPSQRRRIDTAHRGGVSCNLQYTLHASPRSGNIRSGSTDPWATSGFVEEESGMDRSSDEPEEISGHEGSDDYVEPKIELADEDVMMMDDLQEADMESVNATDEGKLVVRQKRPRGRPRKHPLQTLEVTKVQKGRSKTGCITCRRRKKKCDETKPVCMNCEKNAVICEGYPDRTIWKSGREKNDEAGTSTATSPISPIQSLMAAALLRRVSLPTIQLAPIIHGVVTPGDRIFFEHYCFRLSAVLTVEGPKKNAFKDMLLPMAIQHLGLMHSILALSSTNIDYQEPYGRALLAKHPDVNEEILRERAEYHQQEALKEFNLDIQRQEQGQARENILSIRYGQMLCLVVQNIAEGKATGEHRIHLEAYQNLMHESPPDEGPFMEFIEEYFQFHIGLDDIISLPQGPARLGALDEDWSLPSVIQPEAVRLLGVQDGLFFYMSKITAIRNTIRNNMEQGIDPVVDYTSLYRAAEIDVGIRDWKPSWPQGDSSRDLACILYKQMMWVYLWRTIYPPKTTTWQPEYKITSVVNDGIKVLKMFPPKDPVQTLLLAPTFIIGCAAFDPAQRQPIRDSIKNIKEYTNLKNADRAMEVLQEVWRYMDAQDERSWDWQKVAHDMGMDFLAT